MVVSWWINIVLLKTKVFFSHLAEFKFDFFKVSAESDNFLESGQAGQIVEVCLVIDKKIPNFV